MKKQNFLDVIGTLVDLVRLIPPTEDADYTVDYSPNWKDSNSVRICLEGTELVLWYSDEVPTEIENTVRSLATLYGWHFDLVDKNKI